MRTNPYQYSQPHLVHGQYLSASRRPRDRYGSHGDREIYCNSNPREWLTEDRAITFPSYAKNGTHHLHTGTKSFTFPGGNGHNLPEKPLPFWIDSQSASSSQHVHRNASTNNIEISQEYSSTFQRHSIQPPLPEDGYILVIPHSDRGTSTERKQRVSYIVPSSAVQNTAIFRQGNNRQRSCSQMSKSPPWLNGLQTDGMLVFHKKKASQSGLHGLRI